MHQILTIARFELAKKKVVAKPGAIIGLGIVLALFIGAFFLLSNAGYRPVHTYYTIAPSYGLLDTYIDASSTIRLDNNSPVQVTVRSDGSYVLDSRDRFVGIATSSAVLETLKLQNRNLIVSSGVDPTFLLLLNLTTRPREEILQPIVQSNETSNVTRLGERIRRNNSISILISREPLPSPAQEGDAKTSDSQSGLSPDITGEQNSQLVGSGVSSENGDIDSFTQTSFDSTSIDVAALRAQTSTVSEFNSTSQIPDGLQYPGDISTLQGIKDLFIIIQLMLVFNFFSALLGNSFFEEKLNYRSSILFSMPLPRRHVIIGKILPYLCLSLLFAITLLWLQYPHMLAEPLTYLLLFVLGLLYFSFSFINGLLARSNKEYSFINVFTTSILSLYLLIPAFIANYSTLGYASLLTPVLFLAQHQPVSWSLLLFLSTIYAGIAFVVFFLGSALWNYEHLYKYESPIKKLQYILRTNTKSWWQFFVYGVCCVPFLWLAQIIMIAMFLLIPLSDKLFLFLFGAAFCEEYIRNLVIRAHLSYKRASPIAVNLPLTRLKRSIAVGVGFGLAEKIILFIAIAPYLEGYQYIITAGIIVPVLLHSCLSYSFSYLVEKYEFCARHNTLVCAFLGLVHALFNYCIIVFAGVVLI